jgi:hypothetical protein
MSQRGSAPRPASHRSAKPSPETAFSSPGLSQPSPQANTLHYDDSRPPPHDPARYRDQVKREEGELPSTSARTSSLHGMLNASEFSHQYSGSAAGFPGKSMEGEGLRPMTGVPPSQKTTSLSSNSYVFQGREGRETSAASVPGYPPPVGEEVPGFPAQRGSPTGSLPPLPPLGMPRRILTPRSPHVTSQSRAARRNEELQQNPLPRQPSIPEFQDVSPRSRPTLLGPPQQRAPPHAQGVAAAPPPPALSPIAARSLSQPVVSHGLPPKLAPDYLQSSTRPPLPGPGPARYPSQPGPARETPSSGPGGETRWSTSNYGSLAGLPWGRNLPVGESQHLLTITPQYGEEIVVPVDTHQGSKTQDQKRQKNAIASARFRTRKKEREHQLEMDNHELGVRVRELEAERDFYRNERNRLKDIVSQTPSISQWADGPPSPVSNREQVSFQAEREYGAGSSLGHGGQDQSSSTARRRRGPQPRSPPRTGQSHAVESSAMGSAPRPQGQSHPHATSYSLGHPEQSMSEPPARRRRLDEPEFTMPTYGPPPPVTTLPPMVPTPPYGLNPPRLPPTSPGPPRLPPLRMDQPSPGVENIPRSQPGVGPGGPPPPPPLHQSAAQHTSYNPAFGRSYDVGWTQAPPPGPQDGGRR